MQEEFSCQVIQGIGQSCTYTVHADRCGDTQNGEPVEVHVPGMICSTCIEHTCCMQPPATGK